jgi:nucleotidyltransferase substrate binding protein (TIGR01987 family)
MPLDVTSFSDALQTLAEALEVHAKAPENTLMRDGCIQRFEYCYELSHKFLRRYLEATEATPYEISDLSFPDLIRRGYERGLLAAEWVEWKKFREARNITSHGYDGKKAERIFSLIPQFLTEAQFLLQQIITRQEQSID